MRRIGVVSFVVLLSASCGSVSTNQNEGGAPDGGNNKDTGAKPDTSTTGSDTATADTGTPSLDAVTTSSDATTTPDGSAPEAGETEGGAPAPVLLTVVKAGNGAGAIASAPVGIACGADCSESFAAGTMVTLTATADASSTFAGWTGGGCTGTGACVVTVSAATSVTATFTLKTWTLTAALAGTGGGAITSVPAGISCGATCSAAYNHGAMVTLTATPNGTSLFTAWTGACTGSGTCVVTMDQARSVTATFTQASYGLTVTRTGNGAALGTVTSVPAGITCGNSCSSAFAATTMVTLTAAAAAGATFGGWTGGGCTGTGACLVTINAVVNVSAAFTLSQSALTVLKAGTGTGTVTSTPAGISCGATCNEAVDYGTMVTLNAVAANGSMFTGWSGSGCTGTGACVVTVNAASMVTATFTLLQYPVTVTKAGTGGGAVTSNVAGISCGATCQANYNYGTLVTLTATPDAASTFAGWNGNGCSGTGTCLVNVMAAAGVTATFSKSSYVLTLDFVGASAGSVLVTPGNTAFAADGTVVVAAGASVSLAATPGAGGGFGGWGGACSGFATCAFAMTNDTTVTVRFDPPNKVFVTSTVYAPGSLGGLAGADNICATRANAAGLTGTFKAFLGGTNTTAWSRLAGARGWARPDGKAFGDTVADMMAGRIYYPPTLTETGVVLPNDQAVVVTGVNGGATQTCTDWTGPGGGPYDATFGTPGSGWLSIVQNGGIACNYASAHLYCFETTRNVAFRPPAIPAGGRRAFLSAGNVAGSAGLAAFDTQCQTEATAANLPGTYKAMASVPGTAAAARFGAGGAWYRTDNVQLASTAAALLGGGIELMAAMSLRADGLTQEQALVWTGSADIATVGNAGHCGGWTSPAGTTAYMTYGNHLGDDWFGPFMTGACTDSHRVFCFQQ